MRASSVRILGDDEDLVSVAVDELGDMGETKEKRRSGSVGLIGVGGRTSWFVGFSFVSSEVLRGGGELLALPSLAEVPEGRCESEPGQGIFLCFCC